MQKITRELLQIISRNSKLEEQQLEQLLEEHVRPDQKEWHQFLKFTFLTLGIGFSTAGIIFFFAYNWDSLSDFFKIGLAEFLVIATTAIVLLGKFPVWVRKTVLTGAAMLVGVLFAVFGQIYQTGANTYDFFLVWTIFISLWVFVANFSALWLIYLSLVQITFFFYLEQVGPDMELLTTFTLYFVFNAGVIALFHFAKRRWGNVDFSRWLEVVLALIAVYAATSGIASGIHDDKPGYLTILCAFVALGYGSAIWHAYKTRTVFYISIIPFSLIIIIASLSFKISDDTGMFLFVSLFTIAAVTLTIRYILVTHKKWSHDEQ
jgi:uncharacterized membrane protein